MTQPAPPTPAPDAPETDAPTPDPQPKPSETVEYWKQKSRENETRAKANADAAKRLTEIEEASKSEAQKAADRLAAAEKGAADARRESLRLRVAAKHGISEDDADLFLNGDDEATLTRQAERLAGRETERKKQGNHVPREGNTPPAGDNELSAFTQQLFGPGD